MLISKTTTLLASALLAAATLSAGTADAGSWYYRVGANSTQTINLRLCSPTVEISAVGDHDTDVDYDLINPYGRVIHSDYDETDVTYKTVHRSASGCASYEFQMHNLGDVYNNVRLTLEDD